jgi:hypothetical protein
MLGLIVCGASQLLNLELRCERIHDWVNVARQEVL